MCPSEDLIVNDLSLRSGLRLREMERRKSCKRKVSIEYGVVRSTVE